MSDKILDFQTNAVNSVRERMRKLLSSYRYSNSIARQTHDLTLRLIKAQNLEHFLEVLTIDGAHIFGIDVAKICLETQMPEFYEKEDEEFSSLGFIPLQDMKELFYTSNSVVIPKVTQGVIPGFSHIFSGCGGLVKSCTLLKLDLHKLERHGILALGSRQEDFFLMRDSSDSLLFLGEIISIYLDKHLASFA